MVCCVLYYVADSSYGMETKKTMATNSAETDTIVNTYSTLVANLVTDNLTIEPNAVLNTNGYDLFCTGTITNYGTINAGPAPRMNFPRSYGGSGGGAFSAGNKTLTQTGGGNTIAIGGLGSDVVGVYAESGHYVQVPTITSALIQYWYYQGFNNFLSGAPGQSVSYELGGLGSYGIYIQADSIINHGIILATGSPGALSSSKTDLSGGGGGGVIILSYGDKFVPGAIGSQGGSAAIYDGTRQVSGAGGNGQVALLNYSGTPPIDVNDMASIKLPNFAFVGAYADYRITQYTGSSVLAVERIDFKVLDVNKYNETFTFKETYITNGTSGTDIASSVYTASFVDPTPFFVIFKSDLVGFNHTLVPSWMKFANSNVTIHQNTSIRVPAGVFKTYNLAIRQFGASSHFWVDQQSGLIVKQTTSSGPSNTTLVLISTNIMKPVPVNSLLLQIILVSFAVSMVILTLIIGIRRPQNSDKDRIVRNVTVHSESVPFESRIDELKSMLNKGVISREFFDQDVATLNSGLYGDEKRI